MASVSEGIASAAGGVSKKLIGVAGILAVAAMATLLSIGINDNGYRTVVQWPNGTTFVKFQPGWYVSLFGKTTRYPDVMTYDYEGNGPSEGSLTDNGVQVRYQDGGKGTVYGKNRFELPTDEESMLKLHRAFRSREGLANRLLRSSVKEAHQLTAGLLTSEEAYAQKRGTYIQWVQDQIENGKYATKLKTVITTTETGEEEEVQVPVIDYGDNGLPNRMGDNPLVKYGIRVATAQITDWSFEKRTLEQIAQKREAQMAIITAKANAL